MTGMTRIRPKVCTRKANLSRHIEYPSNPSTKEGEKRGSASSRPAWAIGVLGNDRAALAGMSGEALGRTPHEAAPNSPLDFPVLFTELNRHRLPHLHTTPVSSLV